MGAVGPLCPQFDFLLQQELEACSSQFHRLLRIATYWNSSTRLFVNPQTGEVLTSPDAEKVGSLHSRLFEEWLRMPLAQRFTELLTFLNTLAASDRQTFLFVLRCPKTSEALLPQSAGPREEQFFSSDLTTLAVMAAGSKEVKKPEVKK